MTTSESENRKYRASTKGSFLGATEGPKWSIRTNPIINDGDASPWWGLKAYLGLRLWTMSYQMEQGDKSFNT